MVPKPYLESYFSFIVLNKRDISSINSKYINNISRIILSLNGAEGMFWDLTDYFDCCTRKLENRNDKEIWKRNPVQERSRAKWLRYFESDALEQNYTSIHRDTNELTSILDKFGV